MKKNIVTLLSASGISQLLPLLATPILTRLYSPDDYGQFAIFMFMSSFLLILSTGRYEQGIIEPKSEKEATRLFFVSVINCFIFMLISSALLVFIWSWRKTIFAIDYDVEMISLLGIYTVLSGVNLSLSQLYIRRGQFKVLASTRVLYAAITVSSQILYSYFYIFNYGMIYGVCSGLLVSIVYALYLSRKKSSFQCGINFYVFKEVLIKFRRYPLYILPSHLLNNAASQVPVSVIGSVYGSAALGHYSLVNRILRAPSGMMASAFGEVFKKEASEEYRKKGQCHNLYLKYIKWLSLLSILPFLVIFFFGEILFGVVFGEEWQVAGTYASVLSPIFYFQFISSPLSSLFIISKNQRLDLIWQCIFIILVISSLTFSVYLNFDILYTLMAISTASSTAYILNIIMSFMISKGEL